MKIRTFVSEAADPALRGPQIGEACAQEIAGTTSLCLYNDKLTERLQGVLAEGSRFQQAAAKPRQV
ncbi:hypothetical protein HHL24_39000 [Paraburkholderia sp. RP-4-7]|uniref:Uncharacterized protein n=1 Tax=Paraburkholderia polaris TaxID=2728848 RepID=A0A848IRJ0_9BURK|nr:hypothetical protein [Paraburkholderia polaris]